ncbi:MAG TPA: polysaccharide pyruvyl transferase family protein [Actinopolymorphaceae bacterium]
MSAVSAAGKPRVLLVGAYERDNFGDLLFLLVTEQHLRQADVCAAAPFAGDMRSLLDRTIPAYGPLLRDETFDVVWTVGGQVGGTDVTSAFRMSATPELSRRFQRSSAAERERLLQKAFGDVPGISPYMPSLLRYPRNSGAISVLNSVGLSGISRAETLRREELIALLRGTDFISVRDRESSLFLTELGIEHTLVPDAVHSLSILRPAQPDPESDIAIFQASKAILGQLGHGNVAAALATSEHLRGLRIRMLMAGTANGHDSRDDLELVASHARQMSPRIDIEILEDRRPFELCDRISEARVVIGTSLHVRIVASAYGIPRVSLSRAKVNRYARHWDPDMPYDVGLDDLDTAIGQAMSVASRPDVVERSRMLSQLAHDSLRDLADRVVALATDQTAADRTRRLELRQHHESALLRSRTRELIRLRRQLDALTSSRSYRLASHMSRIARNVKRPFSVRSGR